jgi:hypothetical protein
VTGAVYSGVKRPRREADNMLSPSAEVENAWRYASTPPYVCMVWYLVKHQGQLYHYLSVLNIMNLLIMCISAASCYVLLDKNIVLSTQFSNISICVVLSG